MDSIVSVEELIANKLNIMTLGPAAWIGVLTGHPSMMFFHQTEMFCGYFIGCKPECKTYVDFLEEAKSKEGALKLAMEFDTELGRIAILIDVDANVPEYPGYTA